MRPWWLALVGVCSACGDHPLREGAPTADAPDGATGGDPDPDRDGLFSVDDNCPTRANPDQADADGDGVGDACEWGVRFDFDGDGFADRGVYRPATGAWSIDPSGGGGVVTTMLPAGGIPVAEDYDGDRRFDAAVFVGGVWHVHGSASGTTTMRSLGAAGEVPVPGDYDGDGRADLATFRTADNTFVLRRSADDVTQPPEQFLERIMVQIPLGGAPVVGDRDGDHRADLGVFESLDTSGNPDWFWRASTGNVFATSFGFPQDVPLTGDFDLDGLTDVWVWRPSTQVFYAGPTRDGGLAVLGAFGADGDVPIIAQFRNDARLERAVYRPSNNSFYIEDPNLGFTVHALGQAGDVPVTVGPTATP